MAVNRSNKSSFFLVVGILFSAAVLFFVTGKALAATNLNGRILLQVQEHGEAWYVNPLNAKRYYLGRPQDAFNLMRSLGLGVSDANIGSYQLSQAPSRLAGRILLQVQDKGQAFYVNPQNLKLYYLGRPQDAFSVMRQLGLGISNIDLAKIPIFGATIVPSTPLDTARNSVDPLAADVKTTAEFKFKYQNLDYTLNQSLSENWYWLYTTAPKTYSYSNGQNIETARNAFYSLFLNIRAGDSSLDDLIFQARLLAAGKNWSSDEFAEFVLALVQYIPYDNEKLATGTSGTNPYYPYETLYLNRGVCSDKTFLAVALLRKLGYGAAIIDFPDFNHSAVGISCPLEYSINNSGYCYVETTNYFPLGVIPKNISSGIAEDGSNFNNLFDASPLKTIEFYQKTTGLVYQNIANTVAQATEISSLDQAIKTASTTLSVSEADLKTRETAVNNLKTQLDAYLSAGQIGQYNSLVPQYNTLVAEYNQILAVYRQNLNDYNDQIQRFNTMTHEFYQKQES